MGISSTDGGNSIDRASALKSAISKSSAKLETQATESGGADKSKAQQSIANFKFSSVSSDEKKQVSKSSEEIASARGDDGLSFKNDAWASTGSNIQFDPISKVNNDANTADETVSTVLEQIKNISDSAIERSETYKSIFDLNQGIEN